MELYSSSVNKQEVTEFEPIQEGKPSRIQFRKIGQNILSKFNETFSNESSELSAEERLMRGRLMAETAINITRETY